MAANKIDIFCELMAEVFLLVGKYFHSMTTRTTPVSDYGLFGKPLQNDALNILLGAVEQKPYLLEYSDGEKVSLPNV